MLQDPRITELMELAATERRPLALAPAEIIRMEDNGLIVDPFTGRSTERPLPPMAPTPLGVLFGLEMVAPTAVQL